MKVEEVAASLRINHYVKILSLRHCKLDISGLSMIVQVLGPQKALTMLDLSGNRLGDEGALLLANVLRTNTTLTMLILNDRTMSPNGIYYLLQALTINTTLVDLALDPDIVDINLHAQIKNVLERNRALSEETKLIQEALLLAVHPGATASARSVRYCLHNLYAAATDKYPKDSTLYAQRGAAIAFLELVRGADRAVNEYRF